MLLSFKNSNNPETGDSSPVSDYTLNSGVMLPCDVQLIDATPLPHYSDPRDASTFVPTPNAGLLLRRVGFDGEFLNERSTPFSHCDDKQLGLVSLPQDSRLSESGCTYCII